MKKQKIAGLVIYGVVLAAALAALCITGRITRKAVSESGTAYEQKVETVAFGYQLKQDFVPQYEKMDAINVHIDASMCARDAGELQVSIIKENGEQILLKAVRVSELPQYGWVEIPADMRLTPGQVNTLVLESIGCLDNGPKITFLDSRLAASAEQQGCNLVYAEFNVENSALKAAFIYSVPIEMYEYLVYYVFGLLLIFLVLL